MTPEQIAAIRQRQEARRKAGSSQVMNDIDALLAEVSRQQALLLSFIGSLTLCDHMGDVGDDITKVLEQAGGVIEWDELRDLRRELGRMGVRTLYDTPLGEDDE